MVLMSAVQQDRHFIFWAGVEDVKIINSVLMRRKDAGYDTETEVNEGEAWKDFGTEAPAHPEYRLDIEDAKEKLESDDNFKLVSIRNEGRVAW